MISTLRKSNGPTHHTAGRASRWTRPDQRLKANGGTDFSRPIPKVLSPDTNMFITDGPFLETKEHIGGFWILEAADMDEAL